MSEAKANTKAYDIGIFSFMAILSLAAACIIWSVLYLERMEDTYHNMLIVAASLAFSITAGSVTAIVMILFKCDG